MTPEQSTRLRALLPSVRENARFKFSMNELHKARRLADDLEQALIGNPGPEPWTAEQWLAYAEREAQPPADRIIRGMTMAQILSGKPPEHFEGD